ncbi:MAG: ActD-like protein [Pseudomonadota bacterium]
MTQAPPPVPDWMLERYALGELPPDQSALLRARLQAEAEAVRAGLTPKGDLAARLEALQASDAAILGALPPRQVAAEVRRRLHLRQADEGPVRRPAWVRWSLTAGPLLAAALVLFFVLAPPSPQHGPQDPELIRTTAKGLEPALKVYRRAGEAQERLEAGAKVAPADLLQLAYVAKGYDHGVILSVDGRGGVTLHLPSEPGGSTALELDGEQSLGFSYELDDAPGFERFFLVSSDKPIDVQVVLAAATTIAAGGKAREEALPLPEHLRQTSVLLEKAPR